MKILLPAALILIIILAFFVADACRVTSRTYHNGNTTLVLTVYNLPVFVFVTNDLSEFVDARAHYGYARAIRSSRRGLPAD
jgi:hypothetical protein